MHEGIEDVRPSHIKFFIGIIQLLLHVGDALLEELYIDLLSSAGLLCRDGVSFSVIDLSTRWLIALLQLS